MTATDEALTWAHDHLPADPSTVIDAMMAAGWEAVGGRADMYVRMWRPGGDRHSILVPLDQTAPEYADMMALVLAQIKVAADAGRQAQQVLAALDGVGQR